MGYNKFQRLLWILMQEGLVSTGSSGDEQNLDPTSLAHRPFDEDDDEGEALLLSWRKARIICDIPYIQTIRSPRYSGYINENLNYYGGVGNENSQHKTYSIESPFITFGSPYITTQPHHDLVVTNAYQLYRIMCSYYRHIIDVEAEYPLLSEFIDKTETTCDLSHIYHHHNELFSIKITPENNQSLVHEKLFSYDKHAYDRLKKSTIELTYYYPDYYPAEYVRTHQYIGNIINYVQILTQYGINDVADYANRDTPIRNLLLSMNLHKYWRYNDILSLLQMVRTQYFVINKPSFTVYNEPIPSFNYLAVTDGSQTAKKGMYPICYDYTTRTLSGAVVCDLEDIPSDYSEYPKIYSVMKYHNGSMSVYRTGKSSLSSIHPIYISDMCRYERSIRGTPYILGTDSLGVYDFTIHFWMTYPMSLIEPGYVTAVCSMDFAKYTDELFSNVPISVPNGSQFTAIITDFSQNLVYEWFPIVDHTLAGVTLTIDCDTLIEGDAILLRFCTEEDTELFRFEHAFDRETEQILQHTIDQSYTRFGNTDPSSARMSLRIYADVVPQHLRTITITASVVSNGVQFALCARRGGYIFGVTDFRYGPAWNKTGGYGGGQVHLIPTPIRILSDFNYNDPGITYNDDDPNNIYITGYTMTHWAYVKKDNKMRIFANGSVVSEFWDYNNYNQWGTKYDENCTSGNIIMGSVNFKQMSVPGYMSSGSFWDQCTEEATVVYGHALWWDNFTPPQPTPMSEIDPVVLVNKDTDTSMTLSTITFGDGDADSGYILMKTEYPDQPISGTRYVKKYIREDTQTDLHNEPILDIDGKNITVPYYGVEFGIKDVTYHPEYIEHSIKIESEEQLAVIHDKYSYQGNSNRDVYNDIESLSEISYSHAHRSAVLLSFNPIIYHASTYHYDLAVYSNSYQTVIGFCNIADERWKYGVFTTYTEYWSTSNTVHNIFIPFCYAIEPIRSVTSTNFWETISGFENAKVPMYYKLLWINMDELEYENSTIGIHHLPVQEEDEEDIPVSSRMTQEYLRSRGGDVTLETNRTFQVCSATLPGVLCIGESCGIFVHERFHIQKYRQVSEQTVYDYIRDVSYPRDLGENTRIQRSQERSLFYSEQDFQQHMSTGTNAYTYGSIDVSSMTWTEEQTDDDGITSRNMMFVYPTIGKYYRTVNTHIRDNPEETFPFDEYDQPIEPESIPAMLENIGISILPKDICTVYKNYETDQTTYDPGGYYNLAFAYRHVMECTQTQIYIHAFVRDNILIIGVGTHDFDLTDPELDSSDLDLLTVSFPNTWNMTIQPMIARYRDIETTVLEYSKDENDIEDHNHLVFSGVPYNRTIEFGIMPDYVATEDAYCSAGILTTNTEIGVCAYDNMYNYTT